MSVILAATLAALPVTYAHQIDSVGPYRLQIAWIDDPIAGQHNGLELYVSPLEPGTAADKQEFKDGIAGLKNHLKLQLVTRNASLTLPLQADVDTPGRYYTPVTPSTAGFYQVNVIGNINEQQVSMALHTPRVVDADFVRFPDPKDPTEAKLAEMQYDITMIDERIGVLEHRVEEFILESDAKGEQKPQFLFVLTLGIAVAALVLALRGRRHVTA